MWAAIIMAVLRAMADTYTAVRAYQMGNYNKRVADKQAERQKVLTASEVDSLERTNRRQLGDIRSAQASSGIAGGGTSFDVLTDQMFENARRISTVQYAGVSAASFMQSAGDLAQRSATSTIYGTYLSGGSQAAGGFIGGSGGKGGGSAASSSSSAGGR